VHKIWGETKIGIKGYFVGLFSRIQQAKKWYKVVR
jgi:hypothetical protein